MIFSVALCHNKQNPQANLYTYMSTGVICDIVNHLKTGISSSFQASVQPAEMLGGITSIHPQKSASPGLASPGVILLEHGK